MAGRDFLLIADAVAPPNASFPVIRWNPAHFAPLIDRSQTVADAILADQSITLTTTAKVLCGRAIALNAAATMDTNTISNDCANRGDFGTGRSDFGSLGFSGPIGGGSTPVPEPGTLALVGIGLAVLGFAAPRGSGLSG